uniref:Uncharacterized protein n=1 Tax=Pseudictyota dubia TaxID=2749911 RepID=A0A7R9VHF9_9STRA
MVTETIAQNDHYGVPHPVQQITPSPPPPAAHSAALQPQGVGVTAGLVTQPHAALVTAPLSVVPNMAQTHPGGLVAACKDTPFPQLHRHNSMPVTSTSSLNDPSRPTAYSMQSSHIKGVNGSHLVTPAALGMSNHNSPYTIPNGTVASSVGVGNLSDAERLLVAENAAYAVNNQFVSHYQHQTPAAGMGAGNMMHHYDHTEPLVRHVTPVVGGGCGYSRRYSDISNYVQEAAAQVPVHIPAQAAQYVDASSSMKLHAAQMLAGGYGQ